MAGIDWLKGFMSRHKDLSLRRPEQCSLGRSIAFNKTNVGYFFEKLKILYERCESFSNGSRVYNLDETSTSTVQKPQKVVAQKGVKQLAQAASGERGTLVTTCCIINAHGTFLPPVMVFPRVYFKPHMLNGAPAGTLGLASPSGWMNSNLFYYVMEHFIKVTAASPENPALLIYDNHESHLSIPVLDLAKANGVTILTLHPHCSHKLQPLDVAIYGPFKTYLSSAMNSALLEKPGVPITIYDIARLVSYAHERALTPSNVISGFKKTGIFPFDENPFQESDFAPSLVTERPEPSQKFPDHPSASSSTHQPSTSLSAGQPSTSLSAGQPSTSLSAGQPATSSFNNSGTLFLSPQELRGYPKAYRAQESGHRGRTKKRSMIATDTPEKQELENRSTKIKRICNTGTHPIKAKRKLATIAPQILSSSSDNESDAPDKLTSDHSSDEIDEDLFTNKNQFEPLLTKPKGDDYVLVEFHTEPKVYYVGKIKRANSELEFAISYMRKREKMDSFSFPNVPDDAIVDLDDIKVILEAPIKCGTTKRQNSSLRFAYNFSNLIIK